MLWIGDAFSDQILHAPGYIVLHLVAPLLITGVDEFLAIAGRAAEVWLQHRIAAVGPELGERIVAPTITPPRSTVWENDHRQVLWRYCFRQRKVGRNFEPIGRFVMHRLHRREIIAVQFLATAVLKSQFLRLPIEQIPLTWFRIAVRREQPKALIFRRRGKGNLFSRQLLL